MNQKVAQQSQVSNEETACYAIDEAVLLLQDWFVVKSARLSKDNVSLIDDLVQEMSMAVLLCHGEHTLSYFKQLAVNRAKNFLRQERRQRLHVEKYCRLSHPKYTEGIESIEDLVDLENKLNSRADGGEGIIQLFARASA